jgi:hypothetical protein
MPQNGNHGRKTGTRMRAHVVRGAAAAAALTIASLCAPAALAQTYGSDNEGIWSRFMKSVGVHSTPAENSDINYTERPPLVVPPSRDLPPPVSDPAMPAPNWPTGTAKTVKHAKPKNDVIPDTAVQTPNPPFQKKPWYNPAGWFSKEEYATFGGEPVRGNLTEPPAGYRVPSADQPYGISPEKKGAKPTAQEVGVAPVTQQSSPPGR